MCKRSKLQRLIGVCLILFVFCSSFIYLETTTTFAATDNSTTLLSNVKNSGHGQISFTIKAPAGFDTYYQVVAKNAKPIMGTSTSISTDVDDIRGKVTNKTGTTNKTSTISVNVKLLGDYEVKVGVGGYYNSNSSLRQSTTIKSRFIGSKKSTALWTAEKKAAYAAKKQISISPVGTATISAATMLIKTNFISCAITLGLGCYAEFSKTYDAILTNTQKLNAGEYVGYYFKENDAGTGVTIYYGTFDSNKNLKNKVSLKTYLYSGYVPKF
ncbi:MAG: hypothetical protein HFE71_01670 [Emergencia sp.]|jgi:hypothetical protein|nr:hypothetical protein [Emergencia sp.]